MGSKGSKKKHETISDLLKRSKTATDTTVVNNSDNIGGN